jgi:Ca-activated chloride channel homolog
MCFSRPEYLIYLWLVVPALAFALYGTRRKLRIRRRLAVGSSDPTIVPEYRFSRLFGRRAMFCMAIALFFFAMAGPELCRGQKPVRRTGVDVLFMLDVSTSMLARDVEPDRLSRAKSEILQISRSLDGGRRGLMLFAATPVIQCPLTNDHELFETLLDMASPDQAEAQGTVYRRAFDTARQLVSEAKRESGSNTVLVLVGDGEDHSGSLGIAVAGLKATGTGFYAIGVGSGRAVPIPLPASAGEQSFLKLDSRGEVVMSAFRPDFFAQVVRASGGQFYHSRPDAPVAARVSESIARRLASSSWVMVPDNRQPIHTPVIAAGLFALFAGIATGDVSRRSRRVSKD